MKRAIFLLPALLSACSISLQKVSEPPPTRVAKVDQDSRVIELSRGVAFALECSDGCDGACEEAAVEVDDSSIAMVRKAYHLPDSGEYRNPTINEATFVIAGLAKGSATVTVRSKCTEDTYSLQVVE